MNKFIVIGRLTSDPVLRETNTSHKVVANFDIAENRKDGKTNYFHITVWGELAKVCNEHLCKGRLVCVEGSINVQPVTYELDTPSLLSERDPIHGMEYIINAQDITFLDSNKKMKSKVLGKYESFKSLNDVINEYKKEYQIQD